MSEAERGHGPSEREHRVSGVAARLLEEQGLPAEAEGGRLLVVDDEDGAIVAAARRVGAEVRTWWRQARGGHKAAPWPPEGEVDMVVLRLPRDWAGFEMLLHACCSRLRPGGVLWVVGGNDEGIKTAGKHMAPLLGEAETLWIKARTRVLQALRPETLVLRDSLAAWARDPELDLPGVGPTRVRTYPGLFALDRLDEGTALLLAHLPPIAPGAMVLDYGCGPGAISVAVAHHQPKARQVLCDVDALAAHAARENLPGVPVLLGDGWTAVELGARFDLVLSNPPLHQGQAEDRGLLEAFVQQLPLRLRDRGEVRLVTWRTAHAPRLLREVLGQVEVLAEDRRYQVVRASAR